VLEKPNRKDAIWLTARHWHWDNCSLPYLPERRRRVSEKKNTLPNDFFASWSWR